MEFCCFSGEYCSYKEPLFFPFPNIWLFIWDVKRLREELESVGPMNLTICVSFPYCLATTELGPQERSVIFNTNCGNQIIKGLKSKVP